MPSRARSAILFFAACWLLVSCCAGCARLPRCLGGEAGNLSLDLDDEQEVAGELAAGRQAVLDMRDPALSGYVFTGTAFDPALVRLDAVTPEDGRVRYVFTALAPGQTDVTIRIRRRNAPQGAPSDVYKLVHLTVR